MSVSLLSQDLNSLQRRYAEDGVVHLAGALDEAGMKYAERAFQWSLGHPGPNARTVLANVPGEFYQDHTNPRALEVYGPLLTNTGLSQLAAHVIGSRHLWFLYEQIWLKTNGARRATPWHQDIAYIPLAGEHAVTIWLNLDPVPKDCSLGFILGSHRGPVYNPTAFDPADPSAAMFAGDEWPLLPDIVGDPDRWNIARWRIEPGDLILFHMATLHGGAPTRIGETRRTISLRFVGDNAYCAARPKVIHQAQPASESEDPMMTLAEAPIGSPFRHPMFCNLL